MKVIISLYNFINTRLKVLLMTYATLNDRREHRRVYGLKILNWDKIVLFK